MLSDERKALDKFIESLLALRQELDYAIEHDGKARSSTVAIITDVEEAMNDITNELGIEWLEQTQSSANKPLNH